MEDTLAFSAKIDSAKVVATVLSCICNSKREQQASCEVNENGITFTVTGRAKSLQAQCHLKSTIFLAFSSSAGPIQFRIGLMTLIECLSIFGTASLAQTALTMSYDSDCGNFSLLLEDQGVVSSCEIRTMENVAAEEDSGAFASLFRASSVVARAIIKSDVLRDAFTELVELAGASTIVLCFSQQKPNFRLSASGVAGSCDIEIPKDSEAFVEFMCDVNIEVNYRLSSLQQAMKALAAASETYIRVNQAGVLCVQHMVQSKAGQNSFVDFLISPDEEEEDQ